MNARSMAGIMLAAMMGVAVQRFQADNPAAPAANAMMTPRTTQLRPSHYSRRQRAQRGPNRLLGRRCK